MPDLQPYYGAIFALVIAVIVLIIIVLIYKLLSRSVRGRRGQRLGISEFHEIDKTRRLILVRRDDVEHLVMIGGGHDLVIESNIETGLTSNTQNTRLSQDDAAQRPLRPAVFGNRRPVLRAVEPTIDGDDNTNNDGL